MMHVVPSYPGPSHPYRLFKTINTPAGQIEYLTNPMFFLWPTVIVDGVEWEDVSGVRVILTWEHTSTRTFPVALCSSVDDAGQLT